MMTKNGFQNKISTDMNQFLRSEEKKYPKSNRIKIDLHCHDYNSNVPDELLGRILGIPETWLTTEKLINSLNHNNVDLITITNHNNAKSCYDLLDKGFDILTGAEFSVSVPEDKIDIHILAYGFNPSQEEKLKNKRKNIYSFQEYALENNIPTIWAHPLYYNHSSKAPSIETFEKLSLLFERFEVINGHRGSWQNLLVKTWVETLSKSKIDEFSDKYKISPKDFCRHPYKKSFTGGSDGHMGIFPGVNGSYLHIPDLKKRLKRNSLSELAKEALLHCETAPYGPQYDREKLMVSYVDYFCQIAINIKDPGLLRMILHKGDIYDKILAFTISNGFYELKRHRLTLNFLKLFHNSFLGNVPSFTKKLLIPKSYSPIFKEASKMANVRKMNPEITPLQFKNSIESIFEHLSDIMIKKVNTKLKILQKTPKFLSANYNEIIQNFDFPSNIRALFTGMDDETKSERLSSINLENIMDGFSFPELASMLILGAHYTSSRVIYNARPLLKTFSDNLKSYQHPKRMLWLSDTFEDKNGVAMVLQSVLKEIQRRDLPIDICICSDKVKSQKNLIVIPPKKIFTLPFYEEQPIRIPEFFDILNLFVERGYDRVISSVEGFMGLTSIYLKNAYNIPGYFYIHTDWMTFAETVLNFDKKNLDRLRRIVRTFYKNFDKVFVLNSDQYKFFTSQSMQYNKKDVCITAHWTEPEFKPEKSLKSKLFNVKADSNILLFAGRLSQEKGVFEIPDIYNDIKKDVPNLKVVFAGKGPAESKLRELLPDAIFAGWVDHKKLPIYYSSADLLILPSKFDAFGCVVLEALSCGLPVIAYKTKGPKDIIVHNKNGYLVNSKKKMTECVSSYFLNPAIQKEFKKAALLRANEYTPETIMNKFLKDVGFDNL